MTTTKTNIPVGWLVRLTNENGEMFRTFDYEQLGNAQGMATAILGLETKYGTVCFVEIVAYNADNETWVYEEMEF